MIFNPIPQGQLHRLLFDHRFALVAADDLERLPHECVSYSTAVGVLHDSNDLLPSLVDLASLSRERIAGLLPGCLIPEQGGVSPPITVLLKSDAEPHRLAADVGRAQLAQSVSGERAWVRVHDPRVWLQLYRVLSPGQFTALMGPAQRWSFFLGGQWLTQENAGKGWLRVRYDDVVWGAMERIGVVNRVLARISASVETLSDLLRKSEFVDELAERGAKKYHIARLEDLVEFCLLGLLVHARFDEHPKVRDVLLRVKKDPSIFDELLTQDEAFWQSVGQSLNMIEGVSK